MIYLKLFLTFLQIGAFSFGGGYEMISLIREKVLMHGWLTEEEMLNMIAVAESTPGPIAVNMVGKILDIANWNDTHLFTFQIVLSFGHLLSPSLSSFSCVSFVFPRP